MRATVARISTALVFIAVSVLGFLSTAQASKPYPWQMGFQEAASPVAERIHALHDTLMVVITVIAIVVIALIAYVIIRYNAKRNQTASQTTHHVLLEVVWTAIPAIIVVALAIPSVKLLYYADEEPKESMVVKVIGHQWYWSYEYPDHDIKFDSYMIEEKDLHSQQLRLLEVDNHVVIPAGRPVCFQLTSADVLHSWAVPAFGIKKDTVPGRLNQTWVQVDKPGLYYGQCSELCGMKHGFMPIVVEVVEQEKFDAWILEAKTKFASLRSSSYALLTY